jgi:hypothetical protein
MNWYYQEDNRPITVAAWSEARISFALSNTEIVGSYPTRGMNTCLRLFYVSSCVSRGLETGWSPVRGVLPSVYKINNFVSDSE